MKNLIYIFSVMFLALFSCQEDILEQSIENKDSGDFAVVNFSLTVPDYSVKTKTAAAVSYTHLTLPTTERV